MWFSQILRFLFLSDRVCVNKCSCQQTYLLLWQINCNYGWCVVALHTDVPKSHLAVTWQNCFFFAGHYSVPFFPVWIEKKLGLYFGFWQSKLFCKLGSRALGNSAQVSNFIRCVNLVYEGFTNRFLYKGQIIIWPNHKMFFFCLKFTFAWINKSECFFCV